MALELKYWNGRGLMEVPRMLLAIAGKFPGSDYTDGRYNAPADNLEANLGRMPVITVGDESIGQSAAINFYLAAENGLLGKSNLEAAKIISIAEHIKEMIAAYTKLVPWGTEPSAEQLDQWFNQGATDVSGTAVRDTAGSRYLTWWMGRIEAVLGSQGFAVGQELSLADVMLYYVFAETLADEHCTAETPAFKRYPFGSLERIQAALEKHPKIKASCDAVAAHPNIQKWREVRGVQGF